MNPLHQLLLPLLQARVHALYEFQFLRLLLRELLVRLHFVQKNLVEDFVDVLTLHSDAVQVQLLLLLGQDVQLIQPLLQQHLYLRPELLLRLAQVPVRLLVCLLSIPELQAQLVEVVVAFLLWLVEVDPVLEQFVNEELARPNPRKNLRAFLSVEQPVLVSQLVNQVLLIVDDVGLIHLLVHGDLYGFHYNFEFKLLILLIVKFS